MHRLRTTLLTGCLASLGAALAWSQGPSDTSAALGSDQFSAIHALLSEAADSALDSAAHAQTATGTQADAQTSPVADPREIIRPDAKEGRLEALRAMLNPILAREGVPEELAAVVLVESAGNPLALSPKGARGLWQLMPDTARRFGLAVNAQRDERIDLEKATTGAARYLRSLYARFGSWPLALAAYNTGEGNVQRAISRAHTQDFEKLSVFGYLPAETRNYVPAVISAANVPSPPATRAAPRVSAALVYALTSE